MRWRRGFHGVGTLPLALRGDQPGHQSTTDHGTGCFKKSSFRAEGARVTVKLRSNRAGPAARAEKLLHNLLPRGRIVDRFDASYLQDLPDILRELYGYTTVPTTNEPAARTLREL